MSQDKLKPGIQARLQRGEERVEVWLYEGSLLDPSAPWQLVVARWPGGEQIALDRPRGSKERRRALAARLEQLHQEGFAPAAEPWIASPPPPEPPASSYGVPLPVDAAQELVEALFSEPVALEDLDALNVHEGALEISEDLDVTGGLLVRGDLRVSGEVRVAERSLLLVTGEVRCSLALIYGGFCCEGTLTAELVYLNSGNDDAFAAEGVTARLLLEAGTATWVRRLASPVWRTMNAVISEVDGSPVRHPLRHPDAMGPDDQAALGLSPDAAATLEALLGGGPGR